MPNLDYLKISQGTVYDPTNGVDGEVRDIWIAEGRIVAAPTDPNVRPSRTIDAGGLVVMPGGTLTVSVAAVLVTEPATFVMTTV